MSRFRRLWAVALLSLALTGCELPNLPTPSATSGGTSIIDLDAVAKALGRDAGFREQLQAANQQLSARVNELALGLQGKLQEEKDKLGQTPSDEAQADFRKLANQAQLQLRRGQVVARQRAQEFQARLVSQFRAEVLPFAQQVAAARGSSVVMVKSTVLWYEPSADITDAVVEAMRAAKPPVPTGNKPAESAGGNPPSSTAPSQ